MSADDPIKRYLVPALARGIRILGLFERDRTEISGVDVARELRLPRATAYRLLHTLEHLGCLAPAAGGRYRVGSAVLRLGFEFIASLEVTDVARDVIDRLRDETGCSAQLVIRDGRDAVVVLNAVGAGAFSTNVSVGARIPAHATVLGRMLLCELTDAELACLYAESELHCVSPGAPRTLPQLKALLCEDLARGYAVSESCFDQEITALVAPVRARDGTFVATVSVTVCAPTRRRDRLVRQVLAAASAISAGLHYRSAEAHAPARRHALDDPIVAPPVSSTNARRKPPVSPEGRERHRAAPRIDISLVSRRADGRESVSAGARRTHKNRP